VRQDLAGAANSSVGAIDRPHPRRSGTVAVAGRRPHQHRRHGALLSRASADRSEFPQQPDWASPPWHGSPAMGRARAPSPQSPERTPAVPSARIRGRPSAAAAQPRAGQRCRRQGWSTQITCRRCEGVMSRKPAISETVVGHPCSRSVPAHPGIKGGSGAAHIAHVSSRPDADLVAVNPDAARARLVRHQPVGGRSTSALMRSSVVRMPLRLVRPRAQPSRAQ